MKARAIDLLHILGEVPEGRWAIFSLPDNHMLSVIVPHGLWSLLSRKHPFLSDVGLMEQVGGGAIERRLKKATELTQPVVVLPEDVDLAMAVEPDWFSVLRRCRQCRKDVPSGEVLEGLSNALPPDSRGEVEILVLCPSCQIQTPHRLSAYGVPE